MKTKTKKLFAVSAMALLSLSFCGTIYDCQWGLIEGTYYFERQEGLPPTGFWMQKDSRFVFYKSDIDYSGDVGLPNGCWGLPGIEQEDRWLYRAVWHDCPFSDMPPLYFSAYSAFGPEQEPGYLGGVGKEGAWPWGDFRRIDCGFYPVVKGNLTRMKAEPHLSKVGGGQLILHFSM